MDVEKVTLKLMTPVARAIKAEAAKCDTDIIGWLEATLIAAWRNPKGVLLKIPHAKPQPKLVEETPELPLG